MLGLAATGRAGGESGSFHRAPMTKRKLIASRKNAQAAPKAFMMAPAGAGPATLVRRALLCQMELAAGSCSSLTTLRIIAEAEGRAKASAMPKPIAKR